MPVSPRNLRAIESLKNIENRDLEKNMNEYRMFFNTLLVLQNYLVKNNVRLPSYKVYLDTLITKFALHGNSIMHGLEGIIIQCKEIGIEAKIFDLPSLHVLVRAQLETLLMAEFLYFNPNDESEIEFRQKNWIYAGLLNRQEIKASSPAQQRALDKDTEHIANLRTFLESSPILNRFTRKQKLEILTEGNERLFNSWRAIMEQSGFTKTLTDKLYKLLSASAHSTGLSLINLHGSHLGYNKKNQSANLILTTSTMITARFITELKRYLKAVEIKYNTFPLNVTDRIEFYSGIISKKT